MKTAVFNKNQIFQVRLNPRLKMSAEAMMLIAEITVAPKLDELEVAELIEGVVGSRQLDEIWSWLKNGGDGEGTGNEFLAKLGFRPDCLNEQETRNLKVLMVKAVSPKLLELEKEKKNLTRKIDSLQRIID